MDSKAGMPEEEAGSRPEHLDGRHAVGSSEDNIIPLGSSARLVDELACPSGNENRKLSVDVKADGNLVSEVDSERNSSIGKNAEESLRSCSADEHQDGPAVSTSDDHYGNDDAGKEVDEQTERSPTQKASPNVNQTHKIAASSSEQDSAELRSLLIPRESGQENSKSALPSLSSLNPENVVTENKDVYTRISVSQPCSAIKTLHRDTAHPSGSQQHGGGPANTAFVENQDCCESDYIEKDAHQLPVHRSLPSSVVDSTDTIVVHQNLLQPSDAAAEEMPATAPPLLWSGSPHNGVVHSGVPVKDEGGNKSPVPAVETKTQSRSPQLKEKLTIFENISRLNRPGSRGLRSLSTSGPSSSRAEGVRRVLSRFRNATARSRQQPHKHLEAAVLEKEEQIKKLKCVLKHRDETVRELQDTVTKKEEDASYLLNEKVKLCHELLTRITEQDNNSSVSCTAALTSSDTPGQQNCTTRSTKTSSDDDRVGGAAARPNEEASPRSPNDSKTPSKNGASSVEERDGVVDWSSCGTKAVDGNERLPLKDKLELFETICKHRDYDNRSRGLRGEVSTARPTAPHSPGASYSNTAASSLFAEKAEELKSLQEEVKNREQLIALLQKAVSEKDVELAEVLQEKFSLSRNFAVYLAKGREKPQLLSGAGKAYRKRVTSRSGGAQIEVDSDYSVRSTLESPGNCEQQHPTALDPDDSFSDNREEHTAELSGCEITKSPTDSSVTAEKVLSRLDRYHIHQNHEHTDVPLLLLSKTTVSAQEEMNSQMEVAQGEVISEGNNTSHYIKKISGHVDLHTTTDSVHLQESAAHNSLDRTEAAGAAGADSSAVITNRNEADSPEECQDSSQMESPNICQIYANATAAAGSKPGPSIEQCRLSTSLGTPNSFSRENPSPFNTTAEGLDARLLSDDGVVKGRNDMGSDISQRKCSSSAEAQQQHPLIPWIEVDVSVGGRPSRTTKHPGGYNQKVETSATSTAWVEERGKDTTIMPVYMLRNKAQATVSSETTEVDAIWTSPPEATQKAACHNEGHSMNEQDFGGPDTTAKQRLGAKECMPPQKRSEIQGDNLESTFISDLLPSAGTSEGNISIAFPYVGSLTQHTPNRLGGWRVSAGPPKREESSRTQCPRMHQQGNVQDDQSGAPVAPVGEEMFEKDTQIAARKADKQRNQGSCASKGNSQCPWRIAESLNGRTVAEVFFEVLLGQMENRMGKMLEDAVGSALEVPDQLEKTLEAYHETKTMQEEIRRLRLENESLKNLFQRDPYPPLRFPEVQNLDKVQRSTIVQSQSGEIVQGGDTVWRSCAETKEASASPTTRQAYCEKVTKAGAFEELAIPTSEQENSTQLRYLNASRRRSRDELSFLAEEVDSAAKSAREMTTDSKVSSLVETSLEEAYPATTEKESIEQLKETVKQLSEKCSYLEALDTMTWKRVQQRLEHDRRARLRLKARYLGACNALEAQLYMAKHRQDGFGQSQPVEPSLSSPICLQ